MSNFSNPGISVNTCDISTVIDCLEKKSYLKKDHNGLLSFDDIINRFQEFSIWLNSTFRINSLQENDTKNVDLYLYLLTQLKTNIKETLQAIRNKSSKKIQCNYICNTCNTSIMKSGANNVEKWDCLLNHEHTYDLMSRYGQYNNKDFQFLNTPTPSTPSIIVEDNAQEPQTNSIITQLQSLEIRHQQPVQVNKPGANDFKFNFFITYDPLIETNYYPAAITTFARRTDKLSEYTIQCSGLEKAACLLCPCFITNRKKTMKPLSNEINDHLADRNHNRFASNAVNFPFLKRYHDFWKGQELAYQAHQVYFFPQYNNTSNSTKCHMCNEIISFEEVLLHIDADHHKAKLINYICSPENKHAGLFLLDLQMSLYANNNNHRMVAVANGTKQKNPINVKENEKKAVPKCAIVKCELKFAADGKVILPGRFEEHQKFLIFSNNLINCNLCNIKIALNLTQIKTHLQGVQHRQAAKINVKSYIYYCEICNLHFKKEDLWNAHFVQGPNRHEVISDIRKSRLAIYECKTCSLEFYGDEISVQRHLTHATSNKASRKTAEIQLPHPCKRLFKSEAAIVEIAKRLVDEAKQVSDCREKVKECCEDLERALNSVYPKCKAYAFGSRISGIGNNQSDLDIFMDIGNMYNGNSLQDATSQEQIVIRSARILKGLKDEFNDVVPIPPARTPIVKLQHRFTDLDCDMSFRHGLGVENTKFLKFCVDLQPILQPLILLLKRWSKNCKFQEHLTNYALAVMAMFFLQTSGYMLAVKVIRELNPHPSRIIDGWETINYTVPKEKMKEFVKPYDKSLKILLRDFFKYFHNFNYSNEVVCPLLGRTIPKMYFCEQPQQNLPIEMKTYIQKIQTEDGEQFRALSPFCVQDPFDLSHNLTKACQSGVIQKFKILCKLSYEFLDSIE